MKHNARVTVLIIAIFLFTQAIGLFLLGESIYQIDRIGDEVTIHYDETSIGEAPDTNPKESFIFILASVIIGTLLLLLIIRFGKVRVWKTWFFLAVFIAISISLEVLMHWILAYILAFLLAWYKLKRKNMIIHNLTEILMYAGISILIIPMFRYSSESIFQDGLFWAFMLLIVISLYDMYAVWKSKHMVKMANFQTKNKMFAGIFIPYEPKSRQIHLKTMKKPRKSPEKQKGQKIKHAILGGGDVAFPLIFSGVVMNHLIIKGSSISDAFLQSLLISVFVAASLSALFIYSKKGRFYPAMPFVTMGCVIGYLLILLI